MTQKFKKLCLTALALGYPMFFTFSVYKVVLNGYPPTFDIFYSAVVLGGLVLPLIAILAFAVSALFIHFIKLWWNWFNAKDKVEIDRYDPANYTIRFK